MKYDPNPPSTPHHHGLLHLLESFESAFTAYHDDGQVVVGWLLAAWFLGYNCISAMIWWQFERREPLHADDYEIVMTGTIRPRRRTEMTENGKEHATTTTTTTLNPFDKSIVIVNLPDGDYSVAKRQRHDLV